MAEEIPKKEIALRLGKAGPQPSAAEKRLAEGIAQKEIAIDSGRDKPFQARPVGRQALSSASTPSEQVCRVCSALSLKLVVLFCDLVSDCI